MMAAIGKRNLRVLRVTPFALLAGMISVVWLGMSSEIFPVRASTTERVVTDYHTGLAISGFDPVAYFTNSRAMVGLPEYETRYGGAIWRFINEGNRAAFIDHPDVYMPVFGGYDPISVARGVAAPGHPEIWLIVGERLYLFRNSKARDIFAAGPDQVLNTAQSQWPTVMRSLVR